MEAVEKVAAAVLYEGYLLWPYRRSAQKNQQRWNFGGVYPRAYSERCRNGDPWLMQTECLVAGTAPRLSLKVRFLQVVERQVGRRHHSGFLEFVDELQVADQRYITWEEATERQMVVADVDLACLEAPQTVDLSIPSASEVESLGPAGAIVRSWRDVHATVEISARRQTSPGGQALFRLRVRIVNDTPWPGEDRETALKHTLASTHTILTVRDGAFISQSDPPEELQGLVEACENVATWPVLAGEPGQRHTMLSSPIILADYPQVAPESPGDLFDGSEIDQLLVLNILTLTDAEKDEMRATDPRAREILDRTEALTADDFMQLHGAIREFRRLDKRHDEPLDIPVWYEELETTVPDNVEIDGAEIRRGSRVRLRPRAGGDILDLALDGKTAIVDSIEQDYDNKIHLTVTLEDDPGRALGLMGQPGHRFFFAPEEVEPLDG